MRSLQLESALIEYLEEAARHLQTDVECGSEVPIEIERRGGSSSRSSLFCYRPLTSEFMGSRWRALGGLASYGRAAAALESFDGLERYVSTGSDRYSNGRGRSSMAQVALWTLLEEVFGEQTDFVLRRERLTRALDRLEQAAFAGAAECSVIATLHGMTIVSPEIALTGGLRIVRPESLVDAPESALPLGPTDRVENLLIAYTGEADAVQDAEKAARDELRRLLWALRLFGDGRVSLGQLAWLRMAGGRWQAMAAGAGGHPHGMLVVTETQEDELRAFCNLVTRRAPTGNALAWAHARFQMGCDRADELEALSDHLLALRALLDPASASDGVVAGRLAALCAPPAQRAQLSSEAVAAIQLECETIAGTDLADRTAIDLARMIADHLRALLRDVICGHLDQDLASLADGLLAEDGGFAEVSQQTSHARIVPRSRRSPVRFKRADAEIPDAGEPIVVPVAPVKAVARSTRSKRRQ